MTRTAKRVFSPFRFLVSAVGNITDDSGGGGRVPFAVCYYCRFKQFSAFLGCAMITFATFNGSNGTGAKPKIYTVVIIRVSL